MYVANDNHLCQLYCTPAVQHNRYSRLPSTTGKNLRNNTIAPQNINGVVIYGLLLCQHSSHHAQDILKQTHRHAVVSHNEAISYLIGSAANRQGLIIGSITLSPHFLLDLMKNLCFSAFLGSYWQSKHQSQFHNGSITRD